MRFTMRTASLRQRARPEQAKSRALAAAQLFFLWLERR